MPYGPLYPSEPSLLGMSNNLPDLLPDFTYDFTYMPG